MDGPVGLAAQGGDESGADDGGFAAAGRADEGEESTLIPAFSLSGGRREAVEEIGGEGFMAVENGFIFFLKGEQTFEGRLVGTAVPDQAVARDMRAFAEDGLEQFGQMALPFAALHQAQCLVWLAAGGQAFIPDAQFITKRAQFTLVKSVAYGNEQLLGVYVYGRCWHKR
ncbi:MAG: hypothetical protein D8M54_00340 [Chloroflexi bacterium]|nr:hypothetical protein [Chloroflexota bacterium]